MKFLETDCPRPPVFDKHDIIRRHLIILAMALLFGLLASLGGNNKETYDFGLIVLSNFIFISLIWNSNLFLLDLLDRKLNWEQNFRKKIIFICLIAFMLPIAVHYFFVHIFCYVIPLEKCGYSEGNIVDLVISISITLLVNAIYAALAFFISWRKTMEEKEELKRNSISAEFETLKNQINPHFLFNSLNTLSNLIDENPKSANEFVQKLSGVYRYVLTQKEKETVLLSDELAFIHSYIYLNKMRFGDNLRVEINIDEKYFERKIVTLGIQMLVENAIKHNIISSQKPLTIKLFMKDEKVFVLNNLQAKKTFGDSNGIGLNNIVDRYSFLSKEQVEIMNDGINFSVGIPLL